MILVHQCHQLIPNHWKQWFVCQFSIIKNSVRIIEFTFLLFQVVIFYFLDYDPMRIFPTMDAQAHPSFKLKNLQKTWLDQGWNHTFVTIECGCLNHWMRMFDVNRGWDCLLGKQTGCYYSYYSKRLQPICFFPQLILAITNRMSVLLTIMPESSHDPPGPSSRPTTSQVKKKTICSHHHPPVTVYPDE